MNSKPTILVVEDEDEVRRVLAITLEIEYQVIEASTSEIALAELAARPPDLIVLDLTLKGSQMSGMELCGYIKGTPNLSDIPILILSGTGTIEDMSAMLAMGIQKYISKPYSPLGLLDAIGRLLKAHGERRKV
jgi:DNA-binding response OmpR family regulator